MVKERRRAANALLESMSEDPSMAADFETYRKDKAQTTALYREELRVAAVATGSQQKPQVSTAGSKRPIKKLKRSCASSHGDTSPGVW